MNVRMDGASLRFKITDRELEELLAGNPVVNQLAIGAASMTVMIDLKPDFSEEMSAQYQMDKDSATLRLTVGAEKLAQLKAMGKSRDGIAVTDGGTTVRLLVDARKTHTGS
ncbi:MAG: hypothetical protein D8M28_04980 [Proteobacteria bacterium]|nr:hypothetical protein [Pseudomonadota bacterium]